ncbi:MAG: hypothetical protein LBC23_00840 [Coriobacteriales bacterium]|jgi:glutamate--cysteine ligase|nr:hypothetical protein [Coriobacteriales bacterium]
MAHHVDVVSAPESQVLALSTYITRGIEHGCADCVGLELEHFIVRAGDQALVPYLNDPRTGAPGVESILERLAPLYDETVFETQGDGSRRIIGLARRYANITLEPGAQLEISIGPVTEIADLETIYAAFRAELDPLLAEFGYEALTYGYHPTASAQSIPLIPKDRYHFMDEHFKATGSHGICMMRATASTQVSIDYTSEADAVRKFRIANALGPLFAFLTDNSPIFEGRRVGSGEAGPTGLAIPKRMVRTVIWDDVDADRSMIAPHTFEEGFGFATYATSLLGAPAIFTVTSDEHGEKHNINQGQRSFAEALAGQQLDRATIEHILSLFFFDVRFKTYIEIRMADSLPIAYALAFVALIKGLFYLEENLRYLEQTLEQQGPLNDAKVAAAKTALREEGYEAVVYGRTAAEWLDELISHACQGLAAADIFYLEPFAQLVAGRATLIEA